MKNIKDIVLIKGKDTGSVYLQEITVDKIRAVFFPKNEQEKYKYLGITWNIFREGSEEYKALQEFYRKVDRRVKPWWCPRFVLRFLHLFGNDNSVIRVRNYRLYRLHKFLTGGVFIRDVKTKYGTLRIYGEFDEYTSGLIKKLENLINPNLEPY